MQATLTPYKSQPAIIMNETTQDTDKNDSVDLITFGPEIDLFCKHIDAIGDVLILMVIVVQKMTEDARKNREEFENEHCEVTEDEKERRVEIPNEHYREWKRRDRYYQHIKTSRALLPRSLLVSLISQYDAYLGRVLRVAFTRKPDILNGSEKKISFDTLSHFPSIDAAREYILEKEVESILRSSHTDQFKWMESAFSVPLTKGLERWPTFIEITERRNLFVHTDGVVSSQYIAVCNLHKCDLPIEIKEGVRLDVPQDYFAAAHSCIYEIGVKLGHVLWRKLLPDERKHADQSFLRTTYELIENGKYELAIRLLDFCCKEFKKFSSEETELILTVNRAQAYKWNGDLEHCKRIMNAIDWSAKSDQFRLADAVLGDNWSRAERLMTRIGSNGVVSQDAYRHWPLFREWRKRPEFTRAYKEIFGIEFPVRSEIEEKKTTQEETEPRPNETTD